MPGTISTPPGDQQETARELVEVFRSSPIGMLLQAAYLVLPACASLSLMLLGLTQGGLRLFFLMATVVSCLALLGSRLSVLRLDYTNQRITGLLGQSKPLEGLAEVYLHTRPGYMNITRGQEPFTGLLVQGLASSERERFVKALQAIAPSAEVKSLPLSFRQPMLVSFLMPFIFYPFLALSIYTVNSSAFGALSLSDLPVPPATAGMKTQGQSLEHKGYEFVLPSRLKASVLTPARIMGGSAPEDLTLFDAWSVTSAVVLVEAGGGSVFEKAVLGVEGPYEMALLALGSRMGLVSARARLSLLEGAKGIRAYRLSDRGQMAALAIYGEREGQGYMHVIVKAKQRGETLHLIVLGKGLLTEPELVEFYRSIKQTER